jgi:hypothetical protein
MSQANTQIAVCQTTDGQVQFEVSLERDTVWLSQQRVSREWLTRSTFSNKSP